MTFLILLIIPLLVALGFFVVGGRRVTLAEFTIHVACQLVVAGLSAACLYWSSTDDVELLNGRITGKYSQHVSCSHSYSCHCHQSCSGSGKDRSCSEQCDTCYEHSYDVDWLLKTNIGDREIDIDRVDRRGTTEPPRWTRSVTGEPAAIQHHYTNYIKAAPDTLFRHQGLVDQFKDQLPVHPGRVYDYHHVDRLVVVGWSAPFQTEWNRDLEELNARVNPARQANVIVVLTHGQPREYSQALEQHWVGGAKNDVIVVIDTDVFLSIDWVDVLAWTDSELFKVKLRDELMAQQTLNPERALPAIERAVQTLYVRKPMKDFEYLRASITPSPTELAVATLIGTLISVGLGVWFFKQELL